MELIVRSRVKQNGVVEEQEDENQMAWARQPNAYSAQAEEVVKEKTSYAERGASGCADDRSISRSPVPRAGHREGESTAGVCPVRLRRHGMTAHISKEAKDHFRSFASLLASGLFCNSPFTYVRGGRKTACSKSHAALCRQRLTGRRGQRPIRR